MHNFIEKFTKINDICKKFAGNRVNEHGNVSRAALVYMFAYKRRNYAALPGGGDEPESRGQILSQGL